MRHALGQVRLKCGVKDMSHDDAKAQLEVYARDLVANYAVQDIVTVLGRWPDTNLWWPKWAELKPLLDERAALAPSVHKQVRDLREPTAAERESARSRDRWARMTPAQRIAEIDEGLDLLDAKPTPATAALRRIGLTIRARLVGGAA